MYPIFHSSHTHPFLCRCLSDTVSHITHSDRVSRVPSVHGQSLQSMGAAQTARLNPYEALRSAVVADLERHLRILITRPADWPLHVRTGTPRPTGDGGVDCQRSQMKSYWKSCGMSQAVVWC